MTFVELALIGPLRLGGGDARTISPRDRVVLSALAVHPGEVVSADRIADALWATQPPETWIKVVQGCIVRLRRVLGPGAIETSRSGYRLSPGSVELDTGIFQQLFRDGQDHLALGVPERAVSSFARALGMWRGRPFEDLEDWPPGMLEAVRLTELRLCVEEDLLEARLHAGEHRDAAADGLVLVSEQPLRERRWALTALAQYRCDRQSDALASIRRAKRLLATELGIGVGTQIAQLEAAILDQDPGLLVEEQRTPPDDACPYMGLAGYDVGDADTFFGREKDIETCVEKLGISRVLILAGPSGSGKSSLLRAGLIPALRARGLSLALFTPGSDPSSSMTAARTSATSPPLLLIDQFEELFTRRDDRDYARAWMEDLAGYAVDQAPVIIAVRADHLAGLTLAPALARLAEQGMHLLSPLDSESLRAAIEGPVARANLRLERGLVDLLVRDSEGEPGSLPLMSYALAETWKRRDGRVLTVEGYQATGGIRVAVARTADQLYEALAPSQRQLLRSMLLRLVVPSEDGEPVRSRVRRDTLNTDPERARVLDLLVRARLVTTEETTVELAHEALARAWPRLRAWLDEDAAGLRILRHLSTTAQGWEALGRPDTELYKGARLDAAVEWTDNNQAELTAHELKFLRTSEQFATSERRRDRAAARRQARQNRQLRVLLACLAIVLAVSVAAAGLAVNRGRDAQRQRDAASAAEFDAQHASLASQSIALRPSNRSAAALLAIEAYRQKPDAIAESSLLGTFTSSPGFMGYTHVRSGFYGGVPLPHGSGAVISTDDGQLRVLDTKTGALSGQFPRPDPQQGGPYVLLKASRNGRFLAEAYFHTAAIPCETVDAFKVHDARSCARFVVFDLATDKRILGPVRAPFTIGDISLSDDGALVAVTGGYDGNVAVYRVSEGKLLGTRPGLPRPAGIDLFRDTGAVTFDAAGNLYLGSMAGPIREFDPRTMAELHTWRTPLMSSHNWLVVTANGTLVASGDQAMTAIDTATGKMEWSTDIGDGINSEPCPFLGVAAAAGRIFCGTYAGRIREFSLGTGQATGDYLDPQMGSVGQLAFSSDGAEMLAFGAQEPVVVRWRLDGAGPVTRMVSSGHVSISGYDSAGRLLVSPESANASGNRPILLWDPAVGTVDARLRPGVAAQWLAGGRVAITRDDGSTRLYDIESGDAVDSKHAVTSDSAVFASTGGRRFFVVRQLSSHQTDNRATYDVRGYDSTSLDAVGPPITIRSSFPPTATAVDGTRRVFVTRLYQGVNTVAFDVHTGGRLVEGAHNDGIVQASSRGALVGGSYNGELEQLDTVHLSPVGDFPGAGAQIRTIQFSTEGRLMLATSDDQSLQLYDVDSRTMLGDPLHSSAPFNANEQVNIANGWLRPDGKAIAVNQGDGVAVWSLDPNQLMAAACAFAGRNLTPSEWHSYLGDSTVYRKTCPSFGAPND